MLCKSCFLNSAFSRLIRQSNGDLWNNSSDRACFLTGLRQQFDDGGQVVPGQSCQEEGAAGGRRTWSAGLHLGGFVREKQVGRIQRELEEGERREVSDTVAGCGEQGYYSWASWLFSECDHRMPLIRFLNWKMNRSCHCRRILASLVLGVFWVKQTDGNAELQSFIWYLQCGRANSSDCLIRCFFAIRDFIKAATVTFSFYFKTLLLLLLLLLLDFIIWHKLCKW